MKRYCYICDKNKGVVFKCDEKNCEKMFHIECARRVCFEMNNNKKSKFI